MSALALWVWLCAAATPDAGTPQHHQHVHEGAADADAPASESLYQLDATWSDAAGKPVKLAELRGGVVVLAMIYTSCQAVCPLLVGDLKKLERALPKAQLPKVRFVLVSFDPARDTPKQLARYAQERSLPAPRWTLLTSDDDAVRELAAALGMRYRPSGGGDFAHSNLISVLDAKGVVVARRVGLGQDPAPLVRAIGELLAR